MPCQTRASLAALTLLGRLRTMRKRGEVAGCFDPALPQHLQSVEEPYTVEAYESKAAETLAQSRRQGHSLVRFLLPRAFLRDPFYSQVVAQLCSDCAETLASSPATIASPGSPPTDFTSPRHFSVLPQSPPHTDPLPTHLQQGPSTRTEFDSLNPIPKYRRRQSIVSEHLARFVESRTPSSSDPQQSPPSSPPRAVRFQRRYSVSIPPQDAERSGSATPLDQGPVVGEKDRSHSGSSSSIASSLLSRYFSLDSSRAGSTSSESDSTFLPTTSYGDPDEEERGVFCSSPEELHPPPPSAFLTSAWSSLTSLSALSFASTSIVTSQQVPEIGEQNTAVARNCRKRSGHASWPPSPPSSPETNADSGIAAQTSSRLSNWSSIRSIHVRFRPCALSLDNSDANAGAGAADDADATVNAFTLRIQDLALQQQQQQAVTNPTAASLFLHSPTGLSTMPSRWPRVETCVGSPPLIKIEYWSGRKKEVVPQGVDLDQVRPVLFLLRSAPTHAGRQCVVSHADSRDARCTATRPRSNAVSSYVSFLCKFSLS